MSKTVSSSLQSLLEAQSSVVDDYVEDEDEILFDEGDFAVFDEMFAEEDMQDPDFMDDSPLDLSSMFDFLTPNVHNTSGSFNIPIQPSHDIAPGERFWVSDKFDFPETGFRRLYCEDGQNLYLGKNIVGKSHGYNCDILVSDVDLFFRADQVAEEVGGKASGLGWSVFVHSAVSLCIADTDGLFEPDSGLDVEKGFAINRNGVVAATFEITGDSWRTRQTSAKFILSKYRFIASYGPSEAMSQAVSYALKEDKCDASIYYGTAVDQGEGPYSSTTRRILSSMTKLSKDQILGLANQAAHYVSKQNFPKIDKPTPIDGSFLQSQITAGSYHGKYSTPFRVLCPVNEITFDDNRLTETLDIYYNLLDPNNYHILDRNDDPIVNSWIELPVVPTSVMTPENYHDARYSSLLKYSSFQAAHLEAELLSKIVGRRGTYYSQYSGVGIIWSRPASNSLLTVAQYYSYDQPQNERLIGKWISARGRFYSPCFKVSRSDVHFATTLPGRALTFHASLMALCAPGELATYESVVGAAICMWIHSSWQSTVYQSNGRFITLCHMSETGDLQSLINKVVKVTKPIKSCDFVYLRLLENFVRDAPPSSVTPLLRLPLKFVSIEKDLHLGCQWHIRGNEHSTRCMAKVAENYLAEKERRSRDIQYYEQQADLLDRLVSNGLTQHEFDENMSSCPDHPTLNVLFYIALAKWSEPSLDSIGVDQSNTGFSIWKMVTDRHSVDLERNVIVPCRVLEAASKLLKGFKGLGPYGLLLSILNGPPIPNIFAMHPKDAKDSDRDISIMIYKMRAAQFFQESLTTVYNCNVESDLMKNPAKYELVVSTISKMLKSKRTIASSEDRSNFCGNMHPEKMSICVLSAAIVSGSTSLVSVASLYACNTKRTVVFPVGHSSNHDIPLGDFGCQVRKEGKRMSLCKTLEMQNHFMQGINANGGGLVNTIFTVGFQAMQRVICKDLIECCAFTTSDDVVRAGRFAKGVNKNLAYSWFVKSANHFLNMALMKENTTKPIVSDNLAEFNNIVITMEGMVPQSPIHSTLLVQPLTANSVIGDIIMALSNSKASLFWGDSPEMAESALEASLKIIQQKWLLKPTEMTLLRDSGLLPRNMSEMISGFFPRNRATFAAIWKSIPEEDRQNVLDGSLNLVQPLYQVAVANKKRKRHICPEFPKQLKRVVKAAEGISAARNTASRLNPKYMDAPKPMLRKKAMTNMFELLESGEDEEFSEIYDQLMPPLCKTYTVRASKNFLHPVVMGTSSAIDRPSSIHIRAKKINLKYRRELTQEEARISSLADDEYLEEMTKLERSAQSEGLKMKLPGGLPLTRGFDGMFFRTPCMFNFSFNLTPRVATQHKFTCNGEVVENINPVIWGGGTLSRCNGHVLCFATGEMSKVKYGFYKLATRGSSIECIKIDPAATRVFTCIKNGKTISCLLDRDFSCIEPPETCFMRSGLSGDITAITNYGNLMLSSNFTGFSMLQSVFRKHNCCFPEVYRTILPAYPWFPEVSTKIERGSVTKLIGSRSVRILELIDGESMLKSQTVDLSKYPPTLANMSEDPMWF